MRAGKTAPWYIKIGDDFEYFFFLRDPDTLAVEDLTGWTGAAELKAERDPASTLIATFTVACSATGVLVTLDDSITAALTATAPGDPEAPPTSWPWVDVELVNLAGKKHTYVEAQVQIDTHVTD